MTYGRSYVLKVSAKSISARWRWKTDPQAWNPHESSQARADLWSNRLQAGKAIHLASAHVERFQLTQVAADLSRGKRQTDFCHPCARIVHDCQNVSLVHIELRQLCDFGQLLDNDVRYRGELRDVWQGSYVVDLANQLELSSKEDILTAASAT